MKIPLCNTSHFTPLTSRRGEGGGEWLGGPLWSPAMPLPMRPHLKNYPCKPRLQLPLKEITHMQFPTPYIRHLCLSQSWCSFLQRRAPSFRPALAQKTQPFTFIASHFATDVRRIPVYILLIVMESLPGRAPSCSYTGRFVGNVLGSPSCPSTSWAFPCGLT